MLGEYRIEELYCWIEVLKIVKWGTIFVKGFKIIVVSLFYEGEF